MYQRCYVSPDPADFRLLNNKQQTNCQVQLLFLYIINNRKNIMPGMMVAVFASTGATSKSGGSGAPLVPTFRKLARRRRFPFFLFALMV